jgi:hypothetical protein
MTSKPSKPPSRPGHPPALPGLPKLKPGKTPGSVRVPLTYLSEYLETQGRVIVGGGWSEAGEPVILTRDAKPENEN